MSDQNNKYYKKYLKYKHKYLNLKGGEDNKEEPSTWNNFLDYFKPSTPVVTINPVEPVEPVKTEPVKTESVPVESVPGVPIDSDNLPSELSETPKQ